MKSNEQKAEFLIELDRILGKMYTWFHTADYESILMAWIMHNRDRKPYHPRAMPRKLPYLARYGQYKSKSIPRILAHVEWVMVEDISYTNFILWLFRKSNFDIQTWPPIIGHTLREICIPLELSMVHKSTHFLYAEWLA